MVSIPHRYSTNKLKHSCRIELVLFVSIPHRYSTNQQRIKINITNAYQFQSLIGILQTFFPLLGHTNIHRFNPSQVFYKQEHIGEGHPAYQCFNPSQVFYKRSSISYSQTNTIEFQSLIGILQTLFWANIEYSKYTFQSLIGILQTLPNQNHRWECVMVSIPHRYSTNQNQQNRKELKREFQSLIGILQTICKGVDEETSRRSFNPSQVFYKRNNSTKSRIY